MTKSKDANDMLASLRQATKLERGQSVPETRAAKGQRAEETSAGVHDTGVVTREERVNVGIRKGLHDLVRERAFLQRNSVQSVVEEALEAFFAKQ
jgi:hypothetical protein